MAVGNIGTIPVALLFVLLAHALHAQTRVEVTPETSNTLVGSIVTVSVAVRSVASLRASQIGIVFDNSILDFVESSPGAFLKSNPAGMSVFFHESRLPQGVASPDTILVDQAILGRSHSSGEGDLVVLSFRALTNGTSPVQLVRVDLRDSANRYFAVPHIDGVVVVGGTSNRSPFFESTPRRNAVLDVLYSYTFDARDPDGDSLSYQILEAPAYIQLDPSTRTISGTPRMLGTSKVSLRANDGKGGSMIQSYQLTVYRGETPPSEPQLLSPADGAKLKKMRDTLRWTRCFDAGVGDRVLYRIRLKGGGLDTMFSNITDTVLVIEQGTLIENSSYVWYVEATDGVDTIRTRETYSFTTPSPTDIGNTPRVSTFMLREIFPQPSGTVAHILLDSRTMTTVRVSCTDYAGREVFHGNALELHPGYNQFTIDVSGFAQGAYVLRLDGADLGAAALIRVVR